MAVNIADAPLDQAAKRLLTDHVGVMPKRNHAQATQQPPNDGLAINNEELDLFGLVMALKATGLSSIEAIRQISESDQELAIAAFEEWKRKKHGLPSDYPIVASEELLTDMGIACQKTISAWLELSSKRASHAVGVSTQATRSGAGRQSKAAVSG
jgi:hypothetical protein